MYEILEGENIILRKAKKEDYKNMLKHVWGNEEVYKWMLFKPTFTKEEALDRCNRSIEYQKENYGYFIALKETDEAIGLCAIKEKEKGIYEECGIAIGPSFHSLGYGKEVVLLLLDLAFNKLGAKEFQYGFFENNLKSKNLALHFGFSQFSEENIIRPWDNASKKIIMMRLSKSLYNTLKSAY